MLINLMEERIIIIKLHKLITNPDSQSIWLLQKRNRDRERVRTREEREREE